MTAIVQYIAECFIGVGNKLSEWSVEEEKPKDSLKTEIKQEPMEKTWVSTYFGVWPIRWEQGGVFCNLDPIFTIILSSITAVCCCILLWIFYFYYFKRVWILPDSATVSTPFQVPQGGRDDNSNAPTFGDRLRPNDLQGSPGTAEIVHEMRRLPDSQRLSRRPIAVNIQPNFEIYDPPPPTISPRPQPCHLDKESLQVEYPESDYQEDCQENYQEDCPESYQEYPDVDLPIASTKIDLNEKNQETDFKDFPVPTEDVAIDEVAEKPLGFGDEKAYHDIPQEDSEDSSSQTEYDRYDSRTRVPVFNPGHGDYKRSDENFKVFSEDKIFRKVETVLETPMSNTVTDRIVLHQFQRGRIGSVPCLAPFAMKLETYLRMTEIEYDVVFDSDSSGPWISYHNENFKGVSSCLAFLKEVFPSQTENFLPSPDMKVVSWFITVLVEHHLYWELIVWRWILNGGKDVLHNQPNWNLIFADPKEIGDNFRMGAEYNGFGHFSDSVTEVQEAIIHDVEALSESLGDKDFLTGTSPKEVDCSAFAVLSQMLWSSQDSPSPFKTIIKAFPNVLQYCDRMKSILWSDWDDILSKHEEFNTSVAAYYDSSADVSPLTSSRSKTGGLSSNSSAYYDSSADVSPLTSSRSKTGGLSSNSSAYYDSSADVSPLTSSRSKTRGLSSNSAAYYDSSADVSPLTSSRSKTGGLSSNSAAYYDSSADVSPLTSSRSKTGGLSSNSAAYYDSSADVSPLTSSRSKTGGLSSNSASYYDSDVSPLTSSRSKTGGHSSNSASYYDSDVSPLTSFRSTFEGLSSNSAAYYDCSADVSPLTSSRSTTGGLPEVHPRNFVCSQPQFTCAALEELPLAYTYTTCTKPNSKTKTMVYVPVQC